LILLRDTKWEPI